MGEPPAWYADPSRQAPVVVPRPPTVSARELRDAKRITEAANAGRNSLLKPVHIHLAEAGWY